MYYLITMKLVGESNNPKDCIKSPQKQTKK